MVRYQPDPTLAPTISPDVDAAASKNKMMHVVPSCGGLQTDNHAEPGCIGIGIGSGPTGLVGSSSGGGGGPLAACLSPAYSAPSSPFDFDIDFLVNENIPQLEIPNLLQQQQQKQQQQQQQKQQQLEQQLLCDTSAICQDNSDADSAFGSCLSVSTNGQDSAIHQVPASPSMFSLDSDADSSGGGGGAGVGSGVLSPTMFSPGGNGSPSVKNNMEGMGTYDNQHQLIQKQRFSVPSASPQSLPPRSPYSPSMTQVAGMGRPSRRLSSTDSGSTSGGGCLSLQDSLNEYDQIQQKVKLEHDMDGLLKQIPIPSSLMVTPVAPNAAGQIKQEFFPQQPPTTQMATITKVTPPAPPLVTPLPDMTAAAAASNQQQPLLRQFLEHKDPRGNCNQLQQLQQQQQASGFQRPFQIGKIESETDDVVEQLVGGQDVQPPPMTMQQCRYDINAIAERLAISKDPGHWSIEDVRKWTSWYQEQYSIVTAFKPFGIMDGRAVSQLSQGDFIRIFPEKGDVIYGHFDIWRCTARTANSAATIQPSPPAQGTSSFGAAGGSLPAAAGPNNPIAIKTEESDISSILEMLNDIQPGNPNDDDSAAAAAAAGKEAPFQPSSLTITPTQPPTLPTPSQPVFLAALQESSSSDIKPPPPSYQETMSSLNTPSNNSSIPVFNSSLSISPVPPPPQTPAAAAAAGLASQLPQLPPPAVLAAAASADPSIPPPPAYPGLLTNLTVPVAPKDLDLDDDDEDEDEDGKGGCKGSSSGGGNGRSSSNIMLWQFLKELLLQPENYSGCIHWLDRDKGVFKIVDSVRVATLWGQRKNRPAMNYDKLSRSLRQYYK